MFRSGLLYPVILLVHIHYQDGFTPLHHASMNGRNDIVEMLLQYGASIDLKNKVTTNLILSLRRSSHSMLFRPIFV